ncbi:MAG: hypothetical protein PHD15_01695 [Clostridia bacterium]|nr:hypothetical protein [Clostridia bacterium]MDD4386464.1 hypothetical protein [Clostridia bacterium]
MDNAQKAIMIGVGLFITIIVIAAVMTITGIGQDLLNQGQSQLSGISGQLQSQLQTQYDQIQMSGTLVKVAINKYFSDPSIIVTLHNNKTLPATFTYVGAANFVTSGATPTVITALTTVPATGATAANISGFELADPTVAEIASASKIALARLSTKGDAIYVEPTGQYRAVLIRRKDTASVLGVAFIRYQ